MEPSEQMVKELMAPSLPEPQRLFGAVLALILAGSGGTNHKGGALDLERQDAYGCTLMHYVCALRNLPALQLLLMIAFLSLLLQIIWLKVLFVIIGFTWSTGASVGFMSELVP